MAVGGAIPTGCAKLLHQRDAAGGLAGTRNRSRRGYRANSEGHRGKRFGKLPRCRSRAKRALYRQLKDGHAGNAVGCPRAILSFQALSGGTIDLAADANLAMREAILAAAMQQRERTLDLVGTCRDCRASWAAAMGRLGRGRSGGGKQLGYGAQHGSRKLHRHWHHPVGGCRRRTSRAAERAQQLLTPLEKPVLDSFAMDVLDPEDPNEQFVEEWFELLGREEPSCPIEKSSNLARAARNISALPSMCGSWSGSA